MIINSIVSLALLLQNEAGSGGFLNNPDLWRVINLLVFVAILVYILRNKIGIGKLLDNRAASIRQQLEQATHGRQEAERRLAEVEARLKELDSEVADIKAEADRDAEREADRLREAAAADAEKVRQMAQREIEGAMKAARTELRAFVADKSVELAETIIRREITSADNSRMLSKYAEDLREVKK